MSDKFLPKSSTTRTALPMRESTERSARNWMRCHKVFITIPPDRIWPICFFFFRTANWQCWSSWAAEDVGDLLRSLRSNAYYSGCIFGRSYSLNIDGHNAHVCGLPNFVSTQSGQQKWQMTASTQICLFRKKKRKRLDGSSNLKANEDKRVKYQLFDYDVDVITPVCFPIYSFK